MKASLVISTLQNLITIHGDLEVGVQNAEFLSSDDFNTIKVKDSDREVNRHWPDDKSLGPRFFLIS